MAINLGLSPEKFWYDDPYLLFSYAKAYEIKLKDDVEEWKIKTNFKAWLEGIYIQNAISSVFSKNHQYPDSPFDLSSSKESVEYNLQSSEEAIKERSKIIDKMLKSK